MAQGAREIEKNGATLRLAEAGAGRPVYVLASGFAGSEAHRALAARFLVVAVESNERDPQKLGEALAALAGGAEKVGLAATGAQCGAALAAAQMLGERACALVFASPQGLPLGAAASADDPLTPLLRGAPAPKLVMIGYNDPTMPKDALTLFRKGLSRANVTLIYDAGADIAGDRPQSFADVAGDFLDRQERYRFMTESVAIG